MTLMNSIPENHLGVLTEHISEVNSKMRMLEAQLNDTRNKHQLLLYLYEYIKKDWPYHILSLLTKEERSFIKMCDEKPSLKEAVLLLKDKAKDSANTIQRRFPDFLDEACKENGIPIDRDSRDPKYTFEKGFLTLEINRQRGIARLSDYEGQLQEFPADIGAIVDQVKKEHRRIFGTAFDGHKFLAKLRNNYLAILKKEGGIDGSSVPIRRITHRLGKNEKGFRTDEFIIQLSRLVERGPTEIDNRQLDLQQTKDSHQGIYIHGLSGRGYIGYLIFKEVK